MENFIFKRDYSEHGAAPEDVTAEDIVPNPLARNYLKIYGEIMSKLPKIIVPKDKETFERLVPKLDELAKRFGGSIEAGIDYKHWHSYIDLILPFFEIATIADANLLQDIAQNTQDFCVEVHDTNSVRVHIMIHYFEDVIPDDMNELIEIAKNINIEGFKENNL